MGNLEKLLVVGVLVVVIAILTVSLFWTKDLSDGGEYGQPEGSSAEPVAAIPAPEEELGQEMPLSTMSPDPLEGNEEDAGKAEEKESVAPLPKEEKPVVGLTPAVDVDEEPVFVDPYEKKYVRYTVKRGDTLGGIAHSQLGDAGMVKEILKLNEGLDPRRLSVGRVILIPRDLARPMRQKSTQEAGLVPAPVTTPKDSAPVKEKTYTVKEGDTLWKIAKKFYGDGGKWKKILDANRGTLPNPDAIKVGTSLRIP